MLRDHPEWLAGAETYFQRYGVVSLLVGRYIGPLRPMLPLVAGMLDMPFVRFVLVSMLAAAGWAVAYMLPGWATGAALRLPLPEGFWSAAGMVAAAIALMLLVVIHSSLREQRWATAVAAGISGSLLLALLLGVPHLSALDEGLIALVQEHRSASMDSLALLITGLGDFKTQLFAGVLVTLLLLFARNPGTAMYRETIYERVWGGDETLIVVSSDLSHYLNYDAACLTDSRAARQILDLDPTLNHQQACGATPINGLLLVARHHMLHGKLLDLRNSGDTAGDKARVVGYGAFAFIESRPGEHPHAH